MTMNSRAISSSTVVRQDTTPDNQEVLWLDSTTSPATLKQYDGNTSSWEPVATSVVSRQNTAPTAPVDGDLWQDTSLTPPVLKSYDGGRWKAAGSTVSRLEPTSVIGSMWVRPTPISTNLYAGTGAKWSPVSVSGEPTHEWPIATGSGPLTDPYGGYDATLNGNASVVSDSQYVGGHAVSNPGGSQSNNVDLGTLGTFGSTMETGFSLGFTIKTTDQYFIIGAVDGDQELTISTDAQSFGTNGAINFQIDGDSGSNTDAIETNTTGYDDGNLYRVVCQTPNALDGTQYEIWVNGSQASTTQVSSQGPGSYNDFTNSVQLFTRTDRSDSLDGVIDAPFAYPRTLTQTEIQADYNKQPWV